MLNMHLIRMEYVKHLPQILLRLMHFEDDKALINYCNISWNDFYVKHILL